MGVPGFYRWAIKRVPGVRQKCTARDRPVEFDNLYLDFNGVVHGAINEWTIQEQEEALYALIEAQIALLLTIVRPRVLLYIALDGVAPRAKMNQQRSRRFRAAKDLEAKAGSIDGVLDKFDRNAVTPGTEFMVRLSARLTAWAKAAVQLPELRGVTVVFSSDLDPGEGEHKIMEVIRHHADQSHCLCSSDADLIFLGLVSSAEHVTVLREKNPNDRRPSPTVAPAAPASGTVDVAAAPPDEEEAAGAIGSSVGAASAVDPGISASDFEFLDIGAIRAWLGGQFPGCNPTRLCTDFVAMCCLAGNDFLPHIEALDIYNGGIDRLLKAYGGLTPAESYLVSEELSLVLPRWRDLLANFAAAEAELLLEAEGLGLGFSKKQAHQGPGPPDDRWDGLSVLLQSCHSRATAEEVRQAMAKQGCEVRSVHQLHVSGPKGRAPTKWLIRFADPASAVKTLVSQRRVRGQLQRLRWVEPAVQEFMEPPTESLEGVDWRPAMAEAIRETFEYWLGSDNLPGDSFLRRHVRMRADRFVPLKVFANFNRLKVWCQDLGAVAGMLRSSSSLEVEGEGDAAMVRAVEDYSVRADETPEQVARQQAALAALGAKNPSECVLTLCGAFYLRHAGPVAAGSPAADNVEGTAAQRSGAFLAGIEWVLRYYLKGCSSWSWFYPAHYPPLCASLAAYAASVQQLPAPPLHAPFPPELQLLAVLPPQSAILLPAALRPLLEGPASPVQDFYPREFDIDIKEGDREWQGVVLLPFVDEARLRNAIDGHVQDPPIRRRPRAFLAAAAHGQGSAATAGAHMSGATVDVPVSAISAWDFRPEQQLDNSRAKGPSSLQVRHAAEAAVAAAAAAAVAAVTGVAGAAQDKKAPAAKKGKGCTEGAVGVTGMAPRESSGTALGVGPQGDLVAAPSPEPAPPEETRRRGRS